MMRAEEARWRTGRFVKTLMKVLIFLPILILVMGEVVLHLWNWLMPVLFHLPAVTFWQALGLLVLSWTLFGGLRGMGPRHRGFGRGGFRERLENMTPEEREKVREWVRNRCSPVGGAAADAQPKA
ncbi:MAG TPA: hypothetical protein VMB47_15425 [Candidatus Aquilonibacter sp.]|nr:hypothetical protein [Candidatus Aquilonibacter sp.]